MSVLESPPINENTRHENEELLLLENTRLERTRVASAQTSTVCYSWENESVIRLELVKIQVEVLSSFWQWVVSTEIALALVIGSVVSDLVLFLFHRHGIW